MERQIILAAVVMATTIFLLCTACLSNPPNSIVGEPPRPRGSLRRKLSSFLKAKDPKSISVKGYPDFEAQFLEAAQSFRPVTDKVTSHSYQTMYGQFLLPFYLKNPSMKMLELGLGCDENYEPGAAAAVWKYLFPTAELWGAERDRGCVEKSLAAGKLEGILPLVGDQNDIPTLDKWINQSGGANFDVVIDDGRHQQCQIWTTFQKLWPHLQPGGLYFIEDLQMSYDERFNEMSSPLCERYTNVVDVVKGMIDDLTHDKAADTNFVFCQKESCVIGKKK